MHFYAGILSFPVLGLLALSGLVILYTGPINQAQHGDLLEVPTVTRPLTLEAQKTSAEVSFPELAVSGVTPPSAANRSTMFAMKPKSGDGPVTQVYVNPANAVVLGTLRQGHGIVGLANRVHGNLNNQSVQVPLPSLSGLAGGEGGLIKRVALGSLVVEVFAGWALILAASGIYLWWPRKRGLARTTLVPRLQKRGRARWRDLHAIPGLALSMILGFFVITGMPWSGYWGDGWRDVSSKITPRPSIDQPYSAVVRSGDLDRFGNKIPWVLRETPVPASDPNGSSSTPAGHNDDVSHRHVVTSGGTANSASLSLDAVAEIARTEGLVPGFSIALPVDTPATKTEPATFGSFTASDPWPGRVQHERTAYIDQFSGKTLALSTPGDWGQGALGSVTEWGVQTHMGSQFGVVSRIVMTIGCVLVLWSIASALTMFVKRRRPGTTGAPRRPTDINMAKRLLAIFAFLGVIYPLWGATAAFVMTMDRLVIRRNARLRVAFGQR